MFNQGGRCASDAETIYVSFGTGCDGGLPVVVGGCTRLNPFCNLAQAIPVLSSVRSLILVRGEAFGTTIQDGNGNSVGQVSIVGQQGAAIVASDSTDPVLHISASNVYLRNIDVESAPSDSMQCILADGDASVTLDGVTVSGCSQGGLVIDGSDYDVVNSIFAENGGTADAKGRIIGGVFLGQTATGYPSRFAFNTVVDNGESGVVCSLQSQVVEATLLAGNKGAGVNPDYQVCALDSGSRALGAVDPGLAPNTYRITATSPCVDYVTMPPANAVAHDIDEVLRPQGKAYDCGASELPE